VATLSGKPSYTTPRDTTRHRQGRLPNPPHRHRLQHQNAHPTSSTLSDDAEADQDGPAKQQPQHTRSQCSRKR